MLTIVAACLIFAGLALAAIDGIRYLRDLRVPNIDLMGASIAFDRVWLAACSLSAAGIALLLGESWRWALALVAGGYFLTLPMKYLIETLSGRTRRWPDIIEWAFALTSVGILIAAVIARSKID